MDWIDISTRALLGGVIVSIFAALGDMVKPKSFAGLFGAAPSVAVASLALTFRAHDPAYVASEARSMVFGSIGLAAYAYVVCRLLRRGDRAVAPVAALALFLWPAVAFGPWAVLHHADQH